MDSGITVDSADAELSIDTEFSAGTCWSEFLLLLEEAGKFPEKTGMIAVFKSVPCPLVCSPP